MAERLSISNRVLNMVGTVSDVATALMICGNVELKLAQDGFLKAKEGGINAVPTHIRFTGWVLSMFRHRIIVEAMAHGLRMQGKVI